MAEPTLALKLADIQAKIGVFAGWGRGAAFGESTWSDFQQATIDDCTQSGLRRFYYPEPIEGMASSYEWSFLRPVTSLAFAQGTSTVPLPEDFGGMDGQLTIVTTTSTAAPWKIEWRNEGFIRERYALTPEMSGPPMFAAEQPIRGTQPTAGQRFQLYLFPLADQDYTLQAAYSINPNYLTGDAPYAYGGPQHTETILESCLAVFEERQDDSAGVHRDAFRRRLMASISMDRKNKPQCLGYNRDRSDDSPYSRSNVHYWAPAPTYNGASFD